MEENDKPLSVREHQQAYGFDRQDRDLLVELNTRVKDLILSIKEKDGKIDQAIGGLQQGKVDKEIFSTHCANDVKDFETQEREIETIWKKFDVHESSISLLNKYMWIGFGAVGVIQFLAPFIISKYFK